MNYQPRSTNPYIMEKKLNECVGGGGLDPSVLEEIEAEISVLGSENATMAQDIIDIKGSLNSINDNLSGFKFYPTGTDIIGLIADDSAYTDEDGNYVVWGTATANQLVADKPNTYKAVASTEDTRGKAGADTATPFKSGINPLEPDYQDNTSQYNTKKTYTLDFIPSFILIKFDNNYNGQGIDFYDVKNNKYLGFWHTGAFTINNGKPERIDSVNNNVVIITSTIDGNVAYIRNVWFYK